MNNEPRKSKDVIPRERSDRGISGLTLSRKGPDLDKVTLEIPRFARDDNSFVCPRSGNRGGFTLIEVLIALAIGSVVVLLTRQLFVAVTDGIGRLEAALSRQERDRLADRWLESAFLSLEAGDKTGSFDGQDDQVRFTTWVLQPGGWMERRRVRVALSDSTLRAESDGEIVLLYSGVNSVSFDYLLEPGAASQWVREWVSPVSAPLAIRMRAGSQGVVDTMVYLIKARG